MASKKNSATLFNNVMKHDANNSAEDKARIAHKVRLLKAMSQVVGIRVKFRSCFVIRAPYACCCEITPGFARYMTSRQRIYRTDPGKTFEDTLDICMETCQKFTKHNRFPYWMNFIEWLDYTSFEDLEMQLVLMGRLKSADAA